MDAPPDTSGAAPSARGARPRRRYELRLSGLVYVAITLLLALGAFNSQNNLLFWSFSFALAVLLVSGIVSGTMLMGIAVTRLAPARATAGRPFTIRYRVSNRNRLTPAFALAVTEAAGGTSAGAERRARGAFGRGGAVPMLAAAPLAFVEHVAPRGTAYAEAACRAVRRGLLRLDTIRVASAFPFGMVVKSLWFTAAAGIIVRPEPIAPPGDLRRQLAAAGSGGRAIPPAPGGGPEFFALREYVPGDRPRSIAWRASARQDRLLVRQTSPHAPLRMTVVLPLSGSSEAGAAEAAIGRAAGLIGVLSEEGYEVGLSVPRYGIDRSPRAGAAHAGRLLDDLALLDLDRPQADARGGARPDRMAWARRSPRRAVVVVIHAGPIDASIGPAGAIHQSAHDGAVAGAPARAAPAPTAGAGTGNR
jgi:uncharacterized protein (DUF58 family)